MYSFWCIKLIYQPEIQGLKDSLRISSELSVSIKVQNPRN